VGNKTFLPALSEFYANAHLEIPEHSSSSYRIEQPTGRKDAFHIGLAAKLRVTDLYTTIDVNKTKFLRPRPTSPEVNKCTWRI